MTVQNEMKGLIEKDERLSHKCICVRIDYFFVHTGLGQVCMFVKIWNVFRTWCGMNFVDMLGQKNNFFIRRQGITLLDKIYTRAQGEYTYVWKGSKSEGFEMPESDTDVMQVFNGISVSYPDQPSSSDSDIIIQTDGEYPGYVRLYCHESMRNNMKISSAMTETGDGFILSSLLFRDRFVDEYRNAIPNFVGHGPCAAFTLPGENDVDVLFCLFCKTWPPVAAEWIDRDRKNNWPSRDLIVEIVHDGCVVIPKGNLNAEDNHMQWRISFPNAERKLVQSMNHTQILCYGLLKAYLKYLLNTNEQVRDLLCSYFMKTILFFCIEEECVIWNKDNLLNCFFLCIGRLIKCVSDGNCPNYFIKGDNMFKGRVFGDERRVLCYYLSKLYHQKLCLFSGVNGVIPEENILSYAEREYLVDREYARRIQYSFYFTNFKNCIQELKVIDELEQTSPNTVDRSFLKIYNDTMVIHLVQLLYQTIIMTGSNKSRYRQLKGLRSFIVQNCMDIDKCTGMLLLATLCYLCREYKEVVIIATKVLKKFWLSCTFYRGRVYNEHLYLADFCGKGLTLKEKFAQGLFTESFCFKKECMFYPPEIELELNQYSSLGLTHVHPVVYSHVLLFLSYYHMNSREYMSNTLNELYIVVHNEVWVDEIERPLSKSLLQGCNELWESWQDNHRDS